MPLYSAIYSIPYLCVAGILIILTIHKYSLNIERLFSGVVFITFFGTRGLIGWDWQSYYPMFKHTPLLWNLDFQSFFILDGTAVVEPGFTLYLSVMKTFLGNWEGLIFISTIIDWLLLDSFLKRYSKNYSFSVLIYFCLCLGTEIDLLRNAKSLLIFLFSIKFIEEKKIFYYLILMFVALTFHYSALILLPLYFLGNYKLSKSLFVVVFILANIIYVFHIPLMTLATKAIGSALGDVIGGKLDNYSSSEYIRGFTIGYFFKFINTCLIIWKYNNMSNSQKFAPFYLLLYLIMIFVTFGMNDISSVSERIEDLFMPVCCILFPVLIKEIRLSLNRKICFSYLILFLTLKLYSDTRIVMYNYDSFIFNNIIFEKKEIEYGNYALQIQNH